ncbi:MAG: hypothetical protein AAGB00_07245 [Planctomycetota bacterium]
MSDATNPFESPQAAAADVSNSPDYAVTPPRPKSPLVFGVLSLIFAAFGIVGGIAGMVIFAVMEDQLPAQGVQPLPFPKWYLTATQVSGFLISLLLLAAGVSLVRHKDSGRKLFNAYSWIAIAVQVLSTAFAVYVVLTVAAGSDAAAIGGVVGGVIGGMMGLIFPVLGMIFLNRNAVKQSLT